MRRMTKAQRVAELLSTAVRVPRPRGKHYAGIGSCLVSTKHKPHKGTGYIRVTHNGVRDYGHRLVAKVVHGRIPPDKEVCHRCDNRACINPKHIYIGTHADNMRDMQRRARRRNDYQPTGESHGMAKLRRKDVIKIRKMYATGRYTQKALGEIFGVTQTHIWRIVNRNSRVSKEGVST